MNAANDDTSSRLRHEAKIHRQHARRLRELSIQARERRDPIAALKYSFAARERTRLAKAADQDRRAL